MLRQSSCEGILIGMDEVTARVGSGEGADGNAVGNTEMYESEQ